MVPDEDPFSAVAAGARRLGGCFWEGERLVWSCIRSVTHCSRSSIALPFSPWTFSRKAEELDASTVSFARAQVGSDPFVPLSGVETGGRVRQGMRRVEA